jgi:hypothetical protein
VLQYVFAHSSQDAFHGHVSCQRNDLNVCHQVQQALKEVLHEFGQVLDIQKTIQVNVHVLGKNENILAETKSAKVPLNESDYPQALIKQMDPELAVKGPDITIRLHSNHPFWNRQLNRPKKSEEHDLKAM